MKRTLPRGVLPIGFLFLAGGLSACTSELSSAPPPPPLDVGADGLGAVPPVKDPCPRFAAGSVVAEPDHLYSRGGVLRARLSYQTTVDADGRRLFCFMTPDGKQNPTFHLWPGERLLLTVTNNVPAATPGLPAMHMADPLPGLEVTGAGTTACGAAEMTPSSVNLHYHGANVPPTCHQDEVIRTFVNAGQTFRYDLKFPHDEPPGLYWYHPHVHGMSEPVLLGGASGAIVVEGIQNLQPAVAGLPQRLLVVRDQTVAGNPKPGGPDNVPSWDLSLNYTPVPFPGYPPAVLRMRPGKKQLWRVVNAAADTILDLQVHYDGAPQPLRVVGLDGVPTGSQDGTRHGKVVVRTDLLLAPGARAEFIVTGPAPTVKHAALLTLGVDTGPIGDSDPQRTLATIETGPAGAAPEPAELLVPPVSGPAGPQRFEGLADERPVKQRRIYFSEVLSDPKDPLSPTNFFVTEDGAMPVLFHPDNPPAIVTTQGAVEDWIVENRTQENHEFHIHQIHFLLLSQNGVPVPAEQKQYLDMIQVPYWTGTGPYPSVTLRMDFRGPTVGDFVYHCHILGHEDNGMMATIRVKPRRGP